MILSFVTGDRVNFTYRYAWDVNKWFEGILEDYEGEYCIIVMSTDKHDKLRYRVHHTKVRKWMIIDHVDVLASI